MAAKLFFWPVVKSLANAAAKRASSPIAKGLVKGAGVLGAGASVSEKGRLLSHRAIGRFLFSHGLPAGNHRGTARSS